jgi:nitrate/TMAO reductase-like tetraheme cytochrome c subunit
MTVPNVPKDAPHRPILILLTSHWISMAGAALVTFAGVSWLFVLPANYRGHVSNPYIGLLVFMAIPIIFFTGLILIPIGIALARRKLKNHLDQEVDRRLAIRRAGIFFVVMTVINVIIGSQVSYRAIAHMETAQFCGQSCHVMKPEFTAHQFAPHKSVECSTCHIVPGAIGWVHAKMGGMVQMVGVVLDNYPRPIESAMENNKLVSSAETCEGCHARDRVIGNSLRNIRGFKSDETNTQIDTVLMMNVGGGRTGGIHGAHMGPGVQMRYAAADKKRQTIPWVEYRNTETGVTRTYSAKDAKIDGLATFEMQCVDCHNRAAHSFESAERALDQAIASGSVSAGLPFVKKTSLALLTAEHKSGEQAPDEIASGLRAFYSTQYPDVATSKKAEIEAAGKTLGAIYSRNVFPDLKVTWGTYVNNLGHTDSAGCFRCHDDAHATADKKTISQDCSACHNALAMEESAPAILKTLGLH